MAAMRLAFTISARNTLPQVRMLHAALARHCPDVRFTWVLCDLPTGLDLPALPFPVLDLLALHDPRVWDMAGRYGVSELCTAIKPAAFLRLLSWPGTPGRKRFTLIRTSNCSARCRKPGTRWTRARKPC